MTQNFDKFYLLDTNILLEDANNIYKISQNGTNLIILPETVLDEIDSKKSGFNEINFQAREFARILENSKIVDTLKINDFKIVRVEVAKDTIVDVISKDEYSVKINNTSPHIINDRKILEVAIFSKGYYSSDTEFISLDIMARTRAISLDIKTNSLNGSKEEEFDYNFIKDFTIDFHQQEHLDNQLITDFDKEYKPHNFCYCFKIKGSDQVILTTIQNKRIRLVDEADIRNQIITPLNKEQLLFSNALLNHFYNVLIVEAKAGSGKTLLALSAAIRLVRQKNFQRIIYIRNSIESLDKGEDIGYLPGYEEKFKIYNHPLMDSLDYIVRTDYKKKKNKKNSDFEPQLDESEVTSRIEQLIDNYNIETMWVGEMRGRTLSNAFVIIDEAQNMSNKTMQMVLSRVDNSCKVVVLGSNKQIDNFYVNKYTNSLTTLLKSTKEENSLVNNFAIRLEKVLRGPITEWAEQIFSNK